jgi:prepilin-type N-terminal cleavage/methylation domain-containing protein
VNHKQVHKESGFTLIEMLVAMAILLVVVAASLSIFTDGLRANQASSLLANMNQNLRAGMNLTIRDLLQTGQGIPTGGIPIPSGPGTTPINRPSSAVAVLTFPITYTAIPAVTPGANLGPIIIGNTTDIVTIIYTDNTLPIGQNLLPAMAANGSSVTVNAATPISGVNNSVLAGDLIMITSPTGTRIQAVTGVNGQVITFALNDAFNLNQRGAPAGGGSVMDLRIGGTFPANTYSATRVWMITYYLNNTINPQVPRLMRQVNLNAPRAVAEVIENLQVTYDFVDGVTNPTNRPTVPAGLSENQIRKVNLFMAARSDAIYTPTNQYFRNSVGTQVSLRSLSFVDRYH